MAAEPNSSVTPLRDDLPSYADLKAEPFLWVAIFLYATAFVLFVGPIVIFILAMSGIISGYFGYVFWVAAITTPAALAVLVLAVIANFVAARRAHRTHAAAGNIPRPSGDDA